MPTPINTHQKDLKRRYDLLVGLLELGADPSEHQAYGTLLEMIDATELCETGKTSLNWYDKSIFSRKPPAEFFAYIKVASVSKKSAKDYTVLVKGERKSKTCEPLVYELQLTEDVEHTCTYKAFQKAKYVMKLPACKHAIAAVLTAEKKINEDVADNNRSIKILSWYTEKGLADMPIELREFAQTIKNLKFVERNLAMQQFFMSEIKKFNL